MAQDPVPVRIERQECGGGVLDLVGVELLVVICVEGLANRIGRGPEAAGTAARTATGRPVDLRGRLRSDGGRQGHHRDHRERLHPAGPSHRLTPREKAARETTVAPHK
jgi:hypothetical protein